MTWTKPKRDRDETKSWHPFTYMASASL